MVDSEKESSFRVGFVEAKAEAKNILYPIIFCYAVSPMSDEGCRI